MNIEQIKQNAEITKTSVCGRHFNTVTIPYDVFAYLTALTDRENPYQQTGTEFVEMNYHSEFVPLIEHAEIQKEQQQIERAEIETWRIANNLF